jgi:phosphate transport system permease protein
MVATDTATPSEAATPPPTRIPTRAEPRLAIRHFGMADFGALAGSLLSSFCLMWLVYVRLTPLAGGVGFAICWYVTFVFTYWLVVRQQNGPLAAKDKVAGVIVATAGIGCLVPLTLVIGYTVWKGWQTFRFNFFTETQEFTGPLSKATDGGGIHAIVGTLEQVGIATILSVPLGVLTALFLNEVGGRFARPVRIVVDAMSATPSILAGLFIYAVIVLQLDWRRDGIAVALALTVLMLPTVTRTSEVVLRLIPNGLREGALALGGTEWRVTRQVVVPTARTGLITAILLGIARVVGETAPLLVVNAGAFVMNANPLAGNQEGLPLFIYRFINFPQAARKDAAWTAAFVLIMIVLVLFTAARLVGGRAPVARRAVVRRRQPKEST